MTITRRSFVAMSAGSLAAASIIPARAQTKVAFRVSSSMPADKNAAHFAWFEQFQKRLTDSVGDRIVLNYFPNGQLGKESDVVQQVKVGSIDMMLTGSSIWATVAPEIGMLDLGYMFDSFAHVAKSLDSGAGQQLADILNQKTGVTILGWGFSFGARNVYTKQNVGKLADLKAVKLRVLPAPAFIKTFEVMEAIPTPIPVNELYTALQTGVVDGFEHDAGTVLSQKFYEVTKHCFLTEHLFSPLVAAIGKRGLAKIPADLKDKFLKAAADATIEQRKIAETSANAAIDELKKLGVTVTPFDKSERSALQKKVAEQLYTPFEGQYPETSAVFKAIAAARG